MCNLLRTIATATCLIMALPSDSHAADDAQDPLQGVWVAKSMEADGKPGPPEVVQRMRFTFQGDKLLIRGNFNDDREVEGTYTVRPDQSPKQLDFSPPEVKQPMLAIYELSEEELKICIRHQRSSAGRPTEFTTKPDSDLVLILFSRQKP